MSDQAPGKSAVWAETVAWKASDAYSAGQIVISPAPRRWWNRLFGIKPKPALYRCVGSGGSEKVPDLPKKCLTRYGCQPP